MNTAARPFTPLRLLWQLAWVVCVLLGAAFAAIRWWPAHWLGQHLERATQHRLLWAHTSGHLWQGQTQLALSGGPTSGPPLRLPGTWNWQLHWQWQNGPLLAFTVHNPQVLQAPWVWQWQPLKPSPNWSLTPSQWRLQADWLQALGAPWDTLALQATMRLQTQAWQGDLNGSGFRTLGGHADLYVDDVGAALVPLRPLGHYHVALSLDGQPRFVLRTTSGPLLLQGQGHWDGQRLRFQGWARADAAQANLLQPLLGALGQRQGQQASLNW